MTALGKKGNTEARTPTGAPKYYVCCIRETDPFIVKADSEGLKEFNKHKEESHGKAAAE